MKKIRPLIVATAFATIILISCKKASATSEALELATSEPTPTNVDTRSPLERDSTRKFIRTAEVKFKAENVARATYAIENITNKLGGFVAYTNLQSHTRQERTNKISVDSSVVTTHFTVDNEMVLRIPNARLDSTLKAITPLIDHLDLRVIKADDFSLRLTSNKMAQNRSSENTKRLADAIDRKGKKFNDITKAEDLLDSKKEQSDHAKLDNLSLKDQISFSTVNISMYQREAVSREIILNPDDHKFDQSLGSRLLDSLQVGWNMVAGILVFFTQLWGLLLIGILIFIGYRKFAPELKK